MEVNRHKSLNSQQHTLSESSEQLGIIRRTAIQPFQDKLRETGLYPLKPTGIEIFQVNLGKMCNQVCNHCHVDAGPDRKEIMTKSTMLEVLKAVEKSGCTTVDLTGGAPEMNPNFRWFVEEVSKLGRKVIVRCNLTIIEANKKYNDLPEFYKKHSIEIISSLPCYTPENTNAQRGKGVFEQSIKALKKLNAVGYGQDGTGLELNLVYNPGGAGIPGEQKLLEADYKRELASNYGITFNQLFTITNVPINRFLEYLITSENYVGYMEKLVDAYNPRAAENVMCRNTISVGWDGYLYDCDFNQMLELKVASNQQHISDFNSEDLVNRNIIVNQHCYACTAGAGSSCSGAIVE